MSPKPKSAETSFRRLLRKGAWVAAGVAVLALLVQGGEYSTIDLLNSRARRASVRLQLARARIELDSLKSEYRAVATDPVRLERMARERFGMVQGEKEVLYWVGGAAGGDSETTVARDSARARRDSTDSPVKPSQ